MNDAVPPKATKKNRFLRSNKLLRHADFERVYKQGRRHFAAHLTAFYLARTEPEPAGPRIGFTVGKALGGAVQRNRIKRRLREAVRLIGFSDSVAVDVVINPKRAVLTMQFTDLQAEIAKVFDLMARSIEKGKR